MADQHIFTRQGRLYWSLWFQEYVTMVICTRFLLISNNCSLLSLAQNVCLWVAGTHMSVYMCVLYVYVVVVSHVVRAGKDTRKQYRVVSSTLDFELYTFVLVIQIRTRCYLECNITLEVNDWTYMYIRKIRVHFPQMFYFWDFTLAHVIYVWYYQDSLLIFQN